MNEMFFDGGHRICVYDDVFTARFLDGLYSFSLASRFRVGWADSIVPEKATHQYLHSVFSEEDMVNCGLIEALATSKLAGEIAGHRISKCILNLVTPSETHFVHTHPEDKGVLIYVNTDWQDGFYGETLFFDDTKRNIIFASLFTPNRAVVFSGSCPHAIRPQSHLAPAYRFTLTLFFNKENNNGRI